MTHTEYIEIIFRNGDSQLSLAELQNLPIRLVQFLVGLSSSDNGISGLPHSSCSATVADLFSTDGRAWKGGGCGRDRVRSGKAWRVS